MQGELKISDAQLDEWAIKARRDNWDDLFVGSDIRQLIGELRRARAAIRRAIATPDREVIKLVEALRPFSDDGSLYLAEVPDNLTPTIYCEETGVKSPACFTVGDLRRATKLVQEYDPRIKLWNDLQKASESNLLEEGDALEGWHPQ